MGRRAKGVLITGVIMALVVVATCAAFYIGLNRSYRAPSPFRCLPASTLQVSRWVRGGLDESLLQLVGGAPVDALLTRVDSLLRADTLLHSRALYISRHDEGVLTVSVCLASRMEWHETLRRWRSDARTVVGDTVVGDHPLLLVHQSGYGEPLYLAAGGGCLFLSPRPDVLATFGGEGHTMRDDAAFATLERTAGREAPLTLYLNTRRGVTLPGPLGRTLLSAATPSDWLAADVRGDEHGIAAEGMMVGPHLSLDVMQAREGISQMGILHRVPSGAHHFTRVGSGRRGLSSAAFCEHLALQPDSQQTAYREAQATLLRLYGADVEGLLSQAFNGEVARGAYSAEGGDFVVLSALSGATAQGQLMAALTAAHRGQAPQQVATVSAGASAVPHSVSPTRLDAQQVAAAPTPVFQGLAPQDNIFFLPQLLGARPPLRLFMRFEDTLVFANDTETLQRLLADYTSGNTLDADEAFTQLCKQFSPECYRFDYRRGVSPYRSVARQLTTAGRLPYLSVYAATGDAAHDMQGAPLWTVRLDSPIQAGPWAVRNHYSNLHECLLQDADNRLILIGADGIVLWKRALDGPVVGNVTQMDYYGNGKLQYLFSTAVSLYVVDRLGNDVATFPVHLPSPSVGGASLAHYSDGSPARLFVATRGGLVLYGPDALRVGGFQPDATEGDLTAPAQHLVCNGKDYIVARDQYSYYYLDRRGRRRLSAAPVAPVAGSPLALSRAQDAFVGVSADGALFATRESDGGVSHVLPSAVSSLAVGAPYGADYVAAGPGRAALFDLSQVEPAITAAFDTHLDHPAQVDVLEPYFAVADSATHLARFFDTSGELPGPPRPCHARVALGEGLKAIVAFAVGQAGELCCWKVK